MSHGIGAKEGVLMAARGPPDTRSVDAGGETQRARQGTIAVTHGNMRRERGGRRVGEGRAKYSLQNRRKVIFFFILSKFLM